VVFRKELIVTVRRRDGGVETYRVVVDKVGGGGRGGDLVTTWAFRLISCLFLDVPLGAEHSISFTDIGGRARGNFCIGNVYGAFLGSWCVARAPYIGFGSSSVAPSRSDYRLVSELARVRASTVVDESVFELRIVGSWTPSDSVSVCEVGLYMHVCDRVNVARYLLFDRSVLSPCVSVPGGSTVVATYTFRF
jgi:hypothetical protein